MIMTIEPVVDPDDPDATICYLLVDEYDIPRGHYDTIDDARRALDALQGNADEARRYARPDAAYYPS